MVATEKAEEEHQDLHKSGRRRPAAEEYNLALVDDARFVNQAREKLKFGTPGLVVLIDEMRYFNQSDKILKGGCMLL